MTNNNNNQTPSHYLLSAVTETINVMNEEAGRVDLGSQTIVVFLAVAQAGTLPQSQLIKLTGMTHAGVSRNVSRLADYGNGSSAGLGLLASFEDPQDRKSKLITLTPKGKQVLSQINKRAGRYFDAAIKKAKG